MSWTTSFPCPTTVRPVPRGRQRIIRMANRRPTRGPRGLRRSALRPVRGHAVVRSARPGLDPLRERQAAGGVLRGQVVPVPEPAQRAGETHGPHRPTTTGRVFPNMVEIGRPNGPTPALLVREPINLETLRAHEHDVLTTYGWADKNTGAIRIPIERAKDLIIERGLPTRTTDAAKEVKQVKEVK